MCVWVRIAFAPGCHEFQRRGDVGEPCTHSHVGDGRIPLPVALGAIPRCLAKLCSQRARQPLSRRRTASLPPQPSAPREREQLVATYDCGRRTHCILDVSPTRALPCSTAARQFNVRGAEHTS